LAPHLEKWILIWVLLSLFLFLYRTMTPRFIEVSRYKDWSLRDSIKFSLKTSIDIWVYRFDGSLYFANSEYFSDKLFTFIREKKDIKLVILDFEWIDDIDLTWLNTLEKTIKKIKAGNIDVYIIRSKLQIKKVLNRSWFMDYFWEEKFFCNIKEALKYSIKDFEVLDKKPLKRYMPSD
jgi:SulP family sulfate permease